RQTWALPSDQPDRGPDGLRHADARPFGGRRERPVTAPQSDGARELLGQEVQLALQAGGAFGVSPVARLLVFQLELSEPSTVVGLGSIVEHGVAVGRPGRDEVVLGQPGANVGGSARRGAYELEDVHLASVGGEERGDVAKTLDVTQTEGFAPVGDRPELPLAPEDRIRRRRLRRLPAEGR